MTPEARLTNRILKELRKEGGFWVKIHGGPMQQAGLPDIIGCYLGRFVAFEVKLPTRSSQASLRQLAILRSIRHSGGHPHIVRTTRAALGILEAIRLLESASESESPDDGELRSTET